MTRLSARSDLAPAVALPAYRPQDHAPGIVHIGIGAFHKAHQAVYTDAALGAAGGNWRIVAASLRSREVAETLNPQDGRYLLITRREAGDEARLIASVAHVIVVPDEPAALPAAIARPETRVVTLTVTEKAYGIDRASGGLDHTHEAVAHDLAAPDAPKGLIGMLVLGLRLRMEASAGPVAVLSCDNLPENGRVTRRLVLDYAQRVDEALADWIAQNVRFPSSMVDRITPASTARTLEDARRLSGVEDRAAVETEPFTHWVIEDDFPAGRPAWEAGGAIFVDDVAPYEKMKLRLLNGTHSLLAYAGFLAGHETIADCMADADLTSIADWQMRAAAATLPPVPGIDLDAYRAELIARFSNPAIRHLTYQIAMDGTEKLPQRILAPLGEADDAVPFAFAVAAWMRYCLGTDDSGRPYELRDPSQEEIAACLAPHGRDAGAVHDALAGLFAGYRPDGATRDAIVARLDIMLRHGMKAAIATFAPAAGR